MREAVIKLVLDVLGEDVQIENETSLLDVGLSSLTFVKLIINIEEMFEIEIPDECLNIQEMGTVEQICNVIERVKSNE